MQGRRHRNHDSGDLSRDPVSPFRSEETFFGDVARKRYHFRFVQLLMHFSKFILVLLIICCSESSCDECVMIVNLSDCGVAGEALSGPRQELALYKKKKVSYTKYK